MATKAMISPGSLVTFALYFIGYVIVIGLISATLPGALRDIVQTLAGAIASFGAAFEVGRRWSRSTGRTPARRDRVLLALAGNALVFAGLFALFFSLLSTVEAADAQSLISFVAIGFPIVFAAAVGMAYLGVGLGSKRATDKP
jgi:hypothetical protein